MELAFVLQDVFLPLASDKFSQCMINKGAPSLNASGTTGFFNKILVQYYICSLHAYINRQENVCMQSFFTERQAQPP